VRKLVSEQYTNSIMQEATIKKKKSYRLFRKRIHKSWLIRTQCKKVWQIGLYINFI